MILARQDSGQERDLPLGQVSVVVEQRTGDDQSESYDRPHCEPDGMAASPARPADQRAQRASYRRHHHRNDEHDRVSVRTSPGHRIRECWWSSQEKGKWQGQRAPAVRRRQPGRTCPGLVGVRLNRVLVSRLVIAIVLRPGDHAVGELLGEPGTTDHAPQRGDLRRSDLVLTRH